MSQEVFLPLLCNPRNQDGWPEVITKEVVDNLHKFIANVYVTIGQMKGKTLLPLPPSEAKEDKSGTKDKDRIHVLESAVVTWTRQIKNVLKTDPETALKEGLNPGPLAELEFWAEKAANLNSIHDQLSGDKASPSSPPPLIPPIFLPCRFSPPPPTPWPVFLRGWSAR